MKKKIIASIVFCVLVALMIGRVGNVLSEKRMNRYMILDDELERLDEKYELQIYGSCHAYTSYIPEIIMKQTDIKAYNMSNPGEIMPATYLRMFERFKKDIPKVALVETWGVNPYETYTPTDYILGSYLQSNIESLPLSKEKLEIIEEFEDLDIVSENSRIAKYKSRLLENSICTIDYYYSFNKANKTVGKNGTDWYYDEMVRRITNYGYKPYAENELLDYPQRQSVIDEGESLEIEPDIMKYVEKIIKLCEEKGVTLIFYRTPYRSTANELRKANYFAEYCKENNLIFFDLEKEIEYDYSCDFYDFEHLSKSGAKKSTEFLNAYILEALQ